MARLTVRQLEDEIVGKLKEQAALHGVSMDEQHRRILRHALLGTLKGRLPFKEFLRQMPDAGPYELLNPFEPG